MYIIEDVWNYIKDYLFHSIRYSKHLGNDVYIKRYNLIIKNLPIYNNDNVTPKFIYNELRKLVKSVYHVNIPNKNSYITLLEYKLYE